MRIIITICIIIILNGCMTYSAGNIPDIRKNLESTTLKKENRKDITFSFSFYRETSEMSFSLSEEKMVKTVKYIFDKSGLFNKVHYVPFEERSYHHLHFDVKMTATPIDTQSNLGLLSGSFLTLIPIWTNTYVDTTMFLYKGNTEVYSLTAAENFKDIIWLPFIIISPFLNHATVGSYVREKTFKYFLNAILEEKLYK